MESNFTSRRRNKRALQALKLQKRLVQQGTQQIEEEYQVYSDVMPTEDEYDSLQLETYSLNILFFLKKVDDEEILESMNACVTYILERQQLLKTRLVSTIFVEDWVINKIPEVFYHQTVTLFQKWPPEERKHPAQAASIEEHDAIDYVMTIGGDGTILALLRILQEYEKTHILPPIITFSQGSLNYLGNFDIKEYRKVIDATVVKNATYDKICIDQRMRLSLLLCKQEQATTSVVSPPSVDTVITTVDDNKGSREEFKTTKEEDQPMQFQFLNEVTIMRDNEAMAQIEIYINNVLLTVVQGDGVLIATPTGSTAYNLSCGGSIVHFSAQVMCVTPIAPHSLSFRPIILPANVDVKIRIPSTARTSAKVTMDGHTKLDLNPEDYIVIRKSPFNVPFVRWSSENQEQIWSTRLYKQLKWNKHIVQKPFKKLVVVNPKL